MSRRERQIRRYRLPMARVATRIEIIRETGSTFRAKIISTPWSEQDYWMSEPMPWRELVQTLSARGHHSTDISDAFDAAGVRWPPSDEEV
jgi:hypothetical protein